MSIAKVEPDTAVDVPKWDLVLFRVPCARCGTDLHGRTEPVCPDCHLSFDWAIVVPLEQLTCPTCDYHLYGLQKPRCPECGDGFVWENVLRDYRRRLKPLFEYHWRKRPIRSLLYSWRLGLNPRRLWRTIEVHDPPAVDGLLALWLATMAFFFVSCWTLSNAGGWVISATEKWMAGRTPTGVADLFGWMAYVAKFRPLYSDPTWSWPAGECLYLTAAVAAWSALVFPALLVLRQSMKQCRVKAAHVLRLCVYTPIPILVAPFACFGVALVADIAALRGPPRWPMRHFLADAALGVIPVVIVLCVLISTAWGYHRYIRMKHSVGVAIIGHLLAVLALLCTGYMPQWLIPLLL